MSFIQWLILGLVAYACGFSIRHYQFKDKSVPKEKRLIYTAVFFAVACGVFIALNFYAMHKATLDIMFVLVSSLVATGIFYYGINTDTSGTMNVPD